MYPSNPVLAHTFEPSLPVPTGTRSFITLTIHLPWLDEDGIVYNTVHSTTTATARNGITTDDPSRFILQDVMTVTNSIYTTAWSTRTLYQVIEEDGAKYSSTTATFESFYYVTSESSTTFETVLLVGIDGVDNETTLTATQFDSYSITESYLSTITSKYDIQLVDYTNPSTTEIVVPSGGGEGAIYDTYFFNIADFFGKSATTTGVNIYYQVTASAPANGFITDLAFAQTDHFIMAGTDNFDILQVPNQNQLKVSWTIPSGNFEYQGLFGPNVVSEGTDTVTQSNLFFVGTFNPSTAEAPFSSIGMLTTSWISTSGEGSTGFHNNFYPGFVLPQYTTWSSVSSFALTSFYPNQLMVYPFIGVGMEGRPSTTTTIVGLDFRLLTADYNSSISVVTNQSGTAQYATDNRAYWMLIQDVNTGLLGIEEPLRLLPQNNSAIWPNNQYGTDQNDIVYQNMIAEFVGTAFTSLITDPIFIGKGIFAFITTISNEGGGFLSQARINQSSLVFSNSTIIHVKYYSDTDGFITDSSTTMLEFQTNSDSIQPDALTLAATASYTTTATTEATEADTTTIATEQTDELRISLDGAINSINLVNWDYNWFQNFFFDPNIPDHICGGNHGAGTLHESVAPFNNFYSKSVTLNGFGVSSTYTTVYNDSVNRNASEIEEVPLNSLRFESGGYVSASVVAISDNQAWYFDWILYHKTWPPGNGVFDTVFAFSGNQKSIYSSYFNGA